MALGTQASEIERYLNTPNVTRINEYLAGGTDHLPADRTEGERLLQACPELRVMIAGNRAFISRAVTWSAEQGIAQFLDLGAGLPARQPAHASARKANPEARVAYVDNDPIALLHTRATQAVNGWGDGIAVVEADLTDPESVLTCSDLREVIDPAEPVCLVFGLVLNLMSARQAREVVTGYADLVPAGSYAAVSCLRFDDAVLWRELRATCTAASPRNHTRRAIAGFLAGLELVPPGLVAAQGWRGGWGDTLPTPPGGAYVLGVVARKP
jgi:hypothetical protein